MNKLLKLICVVYKYSVNMQGAGLPEIFVITGTTITTVSVTAGAESSMHKGKQTSMILV